MNTVVLGVGLNMQSSQIEMSPFSRIHASSPVLVMTLSVL